MSTWQPKQEIDPTLLAWTMREKFLPYTCVQPCDHINCERLDPAVAAKIEVVSAIYHWLNKLKLWECPECGRLHNSEIEAKVCSRADKNRGGL